MDSGDQPTCSKYCREPEAETGPEEMETETTNDTESSNQGSGDSNEEGTDLSPWQLETPATVLRDIGDVLQTSEVKNARLVCRNWTSHMDNSFLLKSIRFAVNATSYQWEPIHYSHALYAPRIFPRMFHCGAHHPMTDKIYMFGGNGLQRNVDNYDFDAHFNDVWTYDMRLKKWDRLLVPGTPYPTPKSRSSLVAWNQYLVLFGGFRRPNRRNRALGAAEFPERVNAPDQEDDSSFDMDGPDRGSLPHEIHYLDVKKNVWETATPVYRETPGLFPGLHDHGAAVYGKWMVVVGGLRSTPWEESVFINTQIFVFDLEEKVWHKAPKPPETDAEKLNAPCVAEFARGTLVLIRPGRFLYHPCFPIRYPPLHAQVPPAGNGLFALFNAPPPVLPIQALMQRQRDELRCYFLDFNPADLLGENWRWTPVPVVSPHILRTTGPLAAPVAVHSDERVRLVNIVSETRRTRRISDLGMYNGLLSFATKIKGGIHLRLAKNTPAEFYDSLAQSPFEFELDCSVLYKHHILSESGGDALKLIVSVLQGRSGHIGDYKVSIRFLDPRYAHLITKGVTNFIEETTVGYLPTKGGGRSPHAASTEKTLQMVRQSNRKFIKLLKADVTALDTQPSPRLVWEETEERAAHEEQPVPSHGLLLLQAHGTVFVTGGESKADEDGVIDVSIGGGTWVANPIK